jgi:uncharacterized protein YbjQ (UPF0145 family)
MNEAPPPVAAAWVRDATADLQAFLAAFVQQISAALPPGQVATRHKFVRYLPPRRVIAGLAVRFESVHYLIEDADTAPRYLRAPASRGIALQGAEDIGIAEWLVALGRELVARAERAGAQSEALRRLIATDTPPPQTARMPVASAPSHVKGGPPMAADSQTLPAAALHRLEQGPGGKRAFSSDLSINEFLMVSEAGFEPVGLVLGSSLYHVGIQVAGFRTNQELDVLSRAMHHARELAIGRLGEEAARLGADGVVGVELTIRRIDWAPGVLEFVAIGTAIRHRNADQGFKAANGRPFLSHLSGQDFWTLLRTGYRPLAMVMGCCVYHIAHRGIMQSLGGVGRNAELADYTQAFYNARELAMDRLQAEIENAGAAGVVGVVVNESSHIWESHVVEFFVLGTAVAPLGADAPRPEAVRPQLVLPIVG